MKDRPASRDDIGPGIVAMGLLLALSCVAAAIPPAPATQPATAPALSAAELALLHRLESGTWRERQSAEAELATGGLDEIPGVRAMLAQTDNADARNRLTAILNELNQQALVAPSLITMHVKNASATSAYAELFRQADATFTTRPANLLATIGPVSLDADRQTFWAVFQQLQHKTGVCLDRALDGTCRLTRNDPIPPGPQLIFGQFLIVATDVRPADPTTPAPVRRKEFHLRLLIYAEPKTHVLPLDPSFTIIHAADNHGNALREAPDGSGPEAWTTVEGAECFPSLEPADKNPGDTLSSFRATMSIQIACRMEPVDIDNITTATPRSVGTGQDRVRIDRCVRNGRQSYAVVIIGSTDREQLFDRFAMENGDPIHLLDAGGRELAFEGTTRWVGEGKMVYYFDGRDPNHLSGPLRVPKRLTWEIPTDIRTVELPIDFKGMHLKNGGN